MLITCAHLDSLAPISHALSSIEQTFCSFLQLQGLSLPNFNYGFYELGFVVQSRLCKRDFKTDQRLFSIGLRSGKFPGQSETFIALGRMAWSKISLKYSATFRKRPLHVTDDGSCDQFDAAIRVHHFHK